MAKKKMGHDALYPYPETAKEAAELLLKKVRGEDVDLSCCTHAAWQVQGFAQANLLPDEDSDEFPVMGATDCCPEDVTDEQCEEALEKLAGTKKTGMKAIPPEVWQTLLAVAMKLLDKWLSK